MRPPKRNPQTTNLQPRDSCGCPCRGRCSLAKIDQYVHWAASIALRGQVPKHFFLGAPWDDDRRGAVGQFFPETIAFVLLEMRADWEQYMSGMGFPYTNQLRFCPVCPCPKHDMHADILPPPYEPDAYLAEINKAHLEICLERSDLQSLWGVLAWDYRKSNGVHGRRVGKAIQVFDHISGEMVRIPRDTRLELGGDVLDAHCALEHFEGPGPFEVHLWRQDLIRVCLKLPPILKLDCGVVFPQ